MTFAVIYRTPLSRVSAISVPFASAANRRNSFDKCTSRSNAEKDLRMHGSSCACSDPEHRHLLFLLRNRSRDYHWSHHLGP